MVKVAYNNCYGGFSLSHAGVKRYAEIKGMKIYAFVDKRDDNGNLDLGKPKRATDTECEDAFCVHYCTASRYSNDAYWSDREIDRTDPALIQTIEELGDKANGKCARLAIAEIAPGTRYRIDEYDGRESVRSIEDYDWKLA